MHRSAHTVPGLVDPIFDGYPAPTFVVDADLRVVALNRVARDLVRDSEEDGALLLARVGDVVECLRAEVGAGCGRERACESCVVREAVRHAFTTGGVHRVKTEMRMRRDGRRVDACMLVSASPVVHDGTRRVVLTLEDISEVARLEQRSLENASVNRLLFELAPSGVVLLDERGRILQFNEQAHRQLGYERDEFARLDLADLEVDESPADVRRHVAAVLEAGGATFDVRQRTRAGAIRQVLVTARPVELGGQRRVLAVWQDITERKLAEEALRYERDLVRSVTENAAEAIFVTDAEGRVTFANREAERVFGFGTEELRGRLLHDAIHHSHPDGRPFDWAECPHRRVLREGERTARREEVFFRKDGTAVAISGAGSPLDVDGRRVGSVFIARDVTDLKEAERALRDSERRFRALIERSTDVIFVYDREGRVAFWSPSASEVLGWTSEEVVGRSRFELVHPEDEQMLAAAVASLLATPGGTGRITTRIRHKDGSWRILESTGRNLLDDPAVQGVVVNGRDVTERIRLEEQFQQAQKLESIGRLAGGVAHDFNNLLTVILSAAEALRGGAAGAPPDPEIVDDIERAGSRARDLTRQLLAFARKQVIAPMPLDVGKLVRGSEHLLRRLLGEDVELSTSCERDPWLVRCDPGQVEQVVMNLAVNARDAMPEGGKLHIEVRNVVLDARGLGDPRPAAGPEEWVRLAIVDTGKGMPPEVRARLFEPFFTTKPAGKGTGLGLATVYGIVKQSGGQIAVRSEPGQGTTFEILLPRTHDVPRADPADATSLTSRGDESVLVVEDEPLVREITTRSLRAAGYRVLSAANGVEAVEAAAREPGPIHLIVTDVVMPGRNGREIAEEVCRGHPEARVLYVSGYTPDAIVDSGGLGRDAEFLAKPFTPSSLLTRVRAVLDAA